MSTSIDDVAQLLVEKVATSDFSSDETTNIIKNLKTLGEAKKMLTPEPEPVPEPSGFKGFLRRHGGDLIKVGGTTAVVTIIAVLEAKGDIIFRSKATKYL